MNLTTRGNAWWISKLRWKENDPSARERSGIRVSMEVVTALLRTFTA